MPLHEQEQPAKHRRAQPGHRLLHPLVGQAGTPASRKQERQADEHHRRVAHRRQRAGEQAVGNEAVEKTCVAVPAAEEEQARKIQPQRQRDIPCRTQQTLFAQQHQRDDEEQREHLEHHRQAHHQRKAQKVAVQPIGQRQQDDQDAQAVVLAHAQNPEKGGRAQPDQPRRPGFAGVGQIPRGQPLEGKAAQRKGGDAQRFCPQHKDKVIFAQQLLRQIDRQVPHRADQIEHDVVMGGVGIAIHRFHGHGVLIELEKAPAEEVVQKNARVQRGFLNIGVVPQQKGSQCRKTHRCKIPFARQAGMEKT